MCNGLCKPEFIPRYLDVVALLPTYDETKHPHCTKDQHALNRHVLLWSALAHMLRPWTTLSPEEDDADSWLFAGPHMLSGQDELCDVYVVPLMWLAGVFAHALSFSRCCMQDVPPHCSATLTLIARSTCARSVQFLVHVLCFCRFRNVDVLCALLCACVLFLRTNSLLQT